MEIDNIGYRRSQRCSIIAGGRGRGGNRKWGSFVWSFRDAIAHGLLLCGQSRGCVLRIGFDWKTPHLIYAKCSAGKRL